MQIFLICIPPQQSPLCVLWFSSFFKNQHLQKLFQFNPEFRATCQSQQTVKCHPHNKVDFYLQEALKATEADRQITKNAKLTITYPFFFSWYCNAFSFNSRSCVFISPSQPSFSSKVGHTQ